MSRFGSRSCVGTRTAQPVDLPAVLSLVHQYRAEAHAERVLTGQTPGTAAAAGFPRLLSDPGHRAVLGGTAPEDEGEQVVGLAVLGVDQLSVVLGVPQVTVDNPVIHREHRRLGVGAALLAAADYAAQTGAEHVVAAVGRQEPSGSASSPAWGSRRSPRGGSCRGRP